MGRMGQKLYIAYGSNLNRAQMQTRCPDAVPLGAGELAGYKLVFRAGGKGVYLTVEPEAGSTVPVGVWAIGPADEAALDEYEAYPQLYGKTELPVRFREFASGQTRQAPALVYIMADGHPQARPHQDYLDACFAGFRDFGLSTWALDTAIAQAAASCGG